MVKEYNMWHFIYINRYEIPAAYKAPEKLFLQGFEHSKNTNR